MLMGPGGWWPARCGNADGPRRLAAGAARNRRSKFNHKENKNYELDQLRAFGKET